MNPRTLLAGVCWAALASAALAGLACDSGSTASTRGGSARASAAAASSATPRASASTAASASVSPSGVAAGASLSQAAPAMPADVKRCEPHQAGTLGSWAPTVDDVVHAAAAYPSEVCLKSALRNDAIRACAAKAGSAIVEISTDDLNGPSGCEVHIGAVESAGRRWVVFFGFFRSPGARFHGGSVAVELTATGPAVYLDALGGKHGSLCPTTGGAPVAPADLPSGWQGLPQPVRDFLCKAAS